MSMISEKMHKCTCDLCGRVVHQAEPDPPPAWLAIERDLHICGGCLSKILAANVEKRHGSGEPK